MFARLTSKFSLRSSAVVLSAWCSAAACSAPPGTDTGDGDIPEFGGVAPGSGNPSTLPPPAAGNGSGPQASANGAGGSTSAPSNEQTGADGIGLDAAQNGSQSSGQNPGAGGSSMVGVDPGTNAGAAGSSFDPGTSGNAGSTSLPPSEPPPQQPPPREPPPQEPPPQQPPAQPPPPAAPPPSGDCNGAFFCDGFESVASGASPTAAVWQVINGYNLVEASANVQVSNANARSGTQALRVAATGGRTGVIATLPQSSYFVRAFFQLDAAPLGPVFIGGGASANDETRFRIQGQSFATINSVGSVGDPVRPGNANGGGCPDCVTLTTNEWLCVEMQFDNDTQTARLFIDGVEAAVAGPDAFATQPANPDLFFGSMGLQGGMTGVWIDDIAVGPQRFGCN